MTFLSKDLAGWHNVSRATASGRLGWWTR